MIEATPLPVGSRSAAALLEHGLDADTIIDFLRAELHLDELAARLAIDAARQLARTA